MSVKKAHRQMNLYGYVHNCPRLITLPGNVIRIKCNALIILDASV